MRSAERTPGASPPARGYVCLTCGATMVEQACRLRCARCGYFEDCENGLTPPPLASPLPPDAR